MMTINNHSKILIVTPTTIEAEKMNFRHHDYLISGIGNVTSAFNLTEKLSKTKYDFLIFVGIAGSFDIKNYPIGAVVEVVDEYFADMGIEKITPEKYQLTTLFEENIINKNTFPFIDGKIYNHSKTTTLPKVTGITVNTITTYLPKIDHYQTKYNAIVETLENGTYFYVAQQFKTNFCVLRAISNKVGERNKTAWNIPQALSNLNYTLQSILTTIETIP